MAKRDKSSELDVEQRPQKKSKTKKHAADREKQQLASNATTHSVSKEDLPYVQSGLLNEVPQHEIDQFLTTNSIKTTDTSTAEAPTLRPIVSFAHLPPCDNNLYEQLGLFKSPTPVQSATWPLLFSGRDVIGIAETGSGKTLAFGLPCLKKILDSSRSKRKPARPSAVIISPTRELAMQIYDQLTKFATPVNIEVACIFGGVKKDSQRNVLKTAEIVVATPGRLKDLQNDGSLDLGKVKYLVLDEADRMLDKGFEQDIRDIIDFMPTSSRQTIMFTATWPPVVRNLAATFMNSSVTVTIGGEPSSDPRANTRIKQEVEVVKPQEKEGRLVDLLNRSQRGVKSPDKVLAFCLYKKEAIRIERLLRAKAFKVAAIHGDMSQQERFSSLEAFKSGTATVLVATDVAARGLDIPSVKLVLNVTFPLTVEDYVHRIGR